MSAALVALLAAAVVMGSTAAVSRRLDRVAVVDVAWGLAFVAIALALTPLYLVVGDWIFWVNGIVMTAAVLLTVASGIDYILTAARAARRP